MKRMPIAKLTRGSAELMVYYDDYQDDIENDTVPSHLSYPLPDYTLEGDEDLIWDFENFVNNHGELLMYYAPMPWSKARRVAYAFAQEKEKEISYKDIFPKKEYEKFTKISQNPNIRY
jgi:hypothetical protein